MRCCLTEVSELRVLVAFGLTQGDVGFLGGWAYAVSQVWLGTVFLSGPVVLLLLLAQKRGFLLLQCPSVKNNHLVNSLFSSSRDKRGCALNHKGKCTGCFLGGKEEQTQFSL